MPPVTRSLEIYKAGKLTVVGFGGQELLDRINLQKCRDEIAELIKEHHCESLAFDFTGIKLVPSGMLGLLASLRKAGVEVHVYNPSRDIRDVIEIMKLDRVMHIHELSL
ncbi:MAG: STAS domain-containing protein [Planctomycetaceae bacterium]